MKKNIWHRIFVLPLIPALIVMAAAAALLVFAFHAGLFDLRGAAIYIFSTYALIVACTLCVRLMDRRPVLKAVFTLPLFPSLLIIIGAAAMLIYVFSIQDFTGIAYVAYALSAYAVILAATNFIRMMRDLNASQYEVSIGTGRASYAVKNRALNSLFAGLLVPFLQIVVICSGYVTAKTLRSAARGRIGSIVLAILSVVGMLIMVIFGPLCFLIGIACIMWWTGQTVRGIALCAFGLLLIVISAHVLQRIMERQKAEMKNAFRPS